MKVSRIGSSAAVLALLFGSPGAVAQIVSPRVDGVATDYPALSVDSIHFEKRLTGPAMTVHADTTTDLYWVDQLDGIHVHGVTADDGIVVGINVGRIRRMVPLHQIDSITFQDGELEAVDSDLDGLSDYEEIIRVGTDPRKADTDGDGWSDEVEVKQFSPTANPHRFNPLVADLPKLEVVLKSTPTVALDYETSAGQMRQRSIMQASTIAEAMTMSQSYTSSYAQEHGWSVGVEAGYESNSGKFVVSAGSHGSYTTENITSWGTQKTIENARSFEEAQLFAREENITYTGGMYMVPISVKNTGNIAYTVKSLLLSAYMIDLNDTAAVQIIGSLSQEGGMLFSPFTLDPGAESGVFNYVNTGLNIETLQALALNSEAVVCGISGYQITMTTADGNTIDFTSSSTTTAARTAEIIVDYGPGTFRDPAKYRVATLSKYNEEYTSAGDQYFPPTMSEIMGMLYMDYAIGEYESDSGLVSVNGIAQDTADNAFWFLIHTRKSARTVDVHSVHNAAFDFDSIIVHTGDVVELIYSKDQDKDGLPIRLERMLGSSDEKLDSDGDGLPDADEFTGFSRGGRTFRTNPSLADTDRDGIDDGVDTDPTHRPVSSSTTIDTLTIVSDADTTKSWSVAAPVGAVTADTFNVNAVAITIRTRTPVALARINGMYTLHRDVSNPLLYRGTVPLTVGANALSLAVLSEDESATDTIDLAIPSSLDNFDAVTVTNVSDGTYRTFNSLRLNFNWAEVRDSRPEGVLVLAGESDLFAQRHIAPRTTNYTLGENLDSGIIVALVDPRSNGASNFTHSGIKFQTSYYYAVYVYQEHDGRFYYSAPVPATGKTTGKVRITVTLKSITLVGLGGDPGDCIEVYNTVSVSPPDASAALPLFSVSSGSPKDVCSASGHMVDASQSFIIAPGQSFTLSWYLSEQDDSSGDDHLGHGDTPVSYDAVMSPYHTTYASVTPKEFTQYSGGDGGSVNMNFTFGWELIE